jgi:hypothetical protein
MPSMTPRAVCTQTGFFVPVSFGPVTYGRGGLLQTFPPWLYAVPASNGSSIVTLDHVSF